MRKLWALFLQRNTLNSVAWHQQPSFVPLFSQRGFTLLESMVSLVVLFSMLSLGAHYLKQAGDRALYQAAAYQLRQIAEAAEAYARDHYDELIALNPAGARLTAQQLKQAGYLPAHIEDEPTNVYQQHYAIYLSPDSKGVLTVLTVTEQGQDLTPGAQVQIALLMGSRGSYIVDGTSGLTGYAQLTVVGSQQAWQLDPTTLQLPQPLQAGHLASMVVLNAQELLSAGDFLRRKRVAGHAEYNQMETDLAMQNNKIHFNKEDVDWETVLQAGTIKLNDNRNEHYSVIDTDYFSLENKKNHTSLKITSQAITASEPQASFSGSGILDNYNYGAELQNNWLKMPLYKVKSNDARAIWTFADHVCASASGYYSEMGRLFMLSPPGQMAGIFACAHSTSGDDGYGQDVGGGAKSRAYLISKIGNNSDNRVPLSKTVTKSKTYPGLVESLDDIAKLDIHSVMVLFGAFACKNSTEWDSEVQAEVIKGFGNEEDIDDLTGKTDIASLVSLLRDYKDGSITYSSVLEKLHDETQSIGPWIEEKQMDVKFIDNFQHSEDFRSNFEKVIKLAGPNSLMRGLLVKQGMMDRTETWTESENTNAPW